MKKIVQILLLCTVIDAIQSIRPGASWNLNGSSYSGLEWIDRVQSKPSLSEVSQAIFDCQSQDTVKKSETAKAISDAKNGLLSPTARLDALIKAINLQ